MTGRVVGMLQKKEKISVQFVGKCLVSTDCGPTGLRSITYHQPKGKRVRSCIIKLKDDARASTIKFTPDLFEGGIIFDKLPYGIYISSLHPIKGFFEKAMTTMFNEVDRVHLKFRYSAPSPRAELFLISRGYARYIDPAGTPNYTNHTIPNGCELSPRTERWIIETERRLLQTDSESVD